MKSEISALTTVVQSNRMTQSETKNELIIQQLKESIKTLSLDYLRESNAVKFLQNSNMEYETKIIDQTILLESLENSGELLVSLFCSISSNEIGIE